MTVYICKCLNSTVTTHSPAAVQLDLWWCERLGEHLRSSASNSSCCNVQLSFMTAIFCASKPKGGNNGTRGRSGVSRSKHFHHISPWRYNKVLFSSFVHGERGEVFTKHSWVSFQISLFKVRYKRYIWGSWFRILFLRPCVYPEPYFCRDGWTASFIWSLHTSEIATGCKFTASGLKRRLSTGGS